MERVRVEAAGLGTACLLAGPPDAPPVLLLHGGGIDRAERSWRETIPALTPRHRIAAPDLPGYGETDGFDRPHTVPDLGDWVLALLEALDIAAVDVVGNSMGGAIALWLGLEAPDRVRRLVPVGSYGIMRRAPLHPMFHLHAQNTGGRAAATLASSSALGARAALSFIFADPRRVTDALVDEMRAEAAVQRTRNAFRDFLSGEVGSEGFRTCLLDRLPNLAVPTLFIHGARDRLIPARHARRAAALTPEARLIILDAGHWAMREQPDAFQAALLDFLDAGVEGRPDGGDVPR